jgi:hypothetical protein
MSSKRKNTGSKSKSRAKSRKIEYDEEDISSEHDSEVDDAEAGSNADGEDAAAEDALADVSNMPELPAPEVIFVFLCDQILSDALASNAPGPAAQLGNCILFCVMFLYQIY